MTYRLALLVSLISVGGCGEKTKIKDNPETKRQLELCQASLDDKKRYIETLERDKTALALKPTGEEVVLVQIDGDLLSVKQGRGPNERSGSSRGNADDTKLYEAFVSSVRGSSGALQKCYQNALKKNSALEVRPITLTMTVSVRPSGTVSGVRLSRSISDTFNECIAAVSQRWKLPPFGGPSVTFETNLKLTPE
jgi:hypothetical protein